MLENFIPDIIEKTIYDIDFSAIKKMGKSIILSDLDNTLIPYDLEVADEKLKNKIEEIKALGFEFIIVSNNKKGRVEKFSNALGLKCFHSALKPLDSGFKKAIKYIKNSYHNEKSLDEIKKMIITLGDQLMTDVCGSKNLKLDCILVRPIKKKSEKWYTKINRKMEAMILKKLEKEYPKVYEELMEKHEY